MIEIKAIYHHGVLDLDLVYLEFSFVIVIYTKQEVVDHWLSVYIPRVSSSLVLPRYVSEAGQTSPSPASFPEGPTSATSTRASTSDPPGVAPLVAPELLLCLVLRRHAVGLPEERRDAVL